MNAKKHILQEKYKGRKSPSYFFDVLKLKAGYPLAYIIGNQPFLDLTIDLSYKPLIPRPETEFLTAEYIFKAIQQKAVTEKIKVLDIFAGSGCIGLAVAKRFADAQVVLSEKNKCFVKQIEKNARINDIKNYTAMQSDVFENIEDAFDIIVANPPYISTRRGDTEVDASVKMFEDKSSLFAPKRGLFFIEMLLNNGRKYLQQDGIMFIEFDPWQKSLIQDLALKHNWENTEFLPDQYGKTRFVRLTA